jgi:pSer/pThr/pTyr-binding forkhead associated (FHA) protein
VGRASAADVPLRHAQVGLRHAYLQLVQGRLACFDLGGRGGIQWPDSRPARAGWVDSGESVGIGPFTLRRIEGLAVHGMPPTDANSIPGTPFSTLSASPANVRWEGAGPDVVLEFPDQGGSNLSRWRMSRVVTLVGRAPGCRVRLPDGDVSWYHCSLVRTPEGVWVVDLMSRVGVFVNGTALRYGRLDHQDELRIGPFRIIVKFADRNSYRAATNRGRRLPSTPIPAQTRAQTPMVPSALSGLVLPDAGLQAPLETELLELLNTQRSSPALVLLVEQFGRMQQQMLEQFNQSLMMLMQHMGDQYREQMRLVRDEMDQLRRLCDELIAMKEQVRPAAADPQLPAPAGNGHGVAVPEPQRANTRDFKRSTLADAPLESTPAASETPTPAPKHGEDPLVMVSRRIAEIRGEQRNRWQKILDLVRSRS